MAAALTSVSGDRGRMTGSADHGLPRVSVIVATRERPDDLARCLPTILANDYPNFEVVVIDQSTSAASGRVVAANDDSRLRYIRQRRVGKSVALNAALREVDGDIVAFTDDDCTAPPDWLSRAVTALESDPEVGIVYGPLVAVPHDTSEFFVPTYHPKRLRRLQGWRGRIRLHVVVGANMVARKTTLDALGRFDECLGPGGSFRTGEDIDVGYRALRSGFAVVQDPTNPILHWGARPYAGGSAQHLIRDSYYALGAVFMKELRCGDALAAYILAQMALLESWRLLANTVRHGRPTGALRLAYLARGAFRSARQPVERSRGLYVPGENA